MSAKVELTSNLNLILQAAEEQIEKALEECGLDAQNFAQDKFHTYSWSDWSTGNLVGSINYQVETDGEGGEMRVGTNVEYGPYVELGTGIYAKGGGRQTAWKFQGPDGKWYWTHGMKPRPFIKPAIAEHKEHYKNVILDNLKS